MGGVLDIGGTTDLEELEAYFKNTPTAKSLKLDAIVVGKDFIKTCGKMEGPTTARAKWFAHVDREKWLRCSINSEKGVSSSVKGEKWVLPLSQIVKWPTTK